jgi:hypothetical protein
MFIYFGRDKYRAMNNLQHYVVQRQRKQRMNWIAVKHRARTVSMCT